MEVDGISNGYFSEAMEEPPIEQDQLKKCNGGSETPPQTGYFDCNICLDFAVDPIVTLCGHLYCWPCIYRWLHTGNISVQRCPVCKASLSEDSLVPIYGRGHRSERLQQSFDIPQRPNSSIINHHDEEDNYDGNLGLVHRHRHHHYHVHQHEHHHHHYPYNNLPLFNDFMSAPSWAMNRVMHSTAGGVLGGMAVAVLPWMFRNQQDVASFQFSSPSPYYVGSNGGSPRLRRQEMEVESSLHQIWLFLFCCAMLCLLLF